MFKNIELSEINNEKVAQSLWILLLVFGLFALMILPVSSGIRELGLLHINWYYIIYSLVYGIPLWGGVLVVYYFIELLTIGKRSTTKSVRILLLFEMILPSVLLINSLFDSNLYFGVLFMSLGILFAQWLRWVYLKSKNRMYNYIK